MTTQILPCKLLATLAASVAFVALTTSAPAQAAFYKCVGTDGSVTYNDSPCAAHESTHLLSKSARRVDGLDCRIARNFAFDAVARMRQNDSTADVFQAYGGADSLSNDARGLINQVYSFQSNYLISAQQIVDLTIDRCQAGLLGNRLNKCDAYPKDFIARYGSCVKARQNEQSGQIMPPSRDTNPGQANKDSEADVDTPSLNAAYPDITDSEQVDIDDETDDDFRESLPDADSFDR